MVSTARIGVQATAGSAPVPVLAGANDPRSSHRGFTLIELLIGVSIVAILLGIGVPSFRSFILDQRLRATSSDLRIALTLARSEAVKRNHAITLKPNAGGWGDGWTIPGLNAGDPDILNQKQVGGETITGPANAVFTPAGRVMAAANFEIKVGPESSGATGCLRIRLDGRTEYCKQTCPFPDPKPDPCP